MRSGIEGFADDLAQLGASMGKRVPVYRRLMELCAQALDGDVGRRLAKAWARRTFTAFYDRPLLLCATLRFDALREGQDHPLWAAIVADPPDPRAASGQALAAALDRDPRRALVWHSLTRRSVQTNEVSRAVAWMWPAALFAGERAIGLVDLGASAGLNLVADAPELGLAWTANGTPLPLLTRGRLRVCLRRGLDRAPLDVTRDEDADWLRACVWPGEPERLDRLERAIAAFRSAAADRAAPPIVETVEASRMPTRLHELVEAADPQPEFWLGYQTVMREYLAASRPVYLTGMRDWLAAMPRGRALWIELEEPPVGATRRRPAALIGHARAASGDVVEAVLARSAYHPVDLAPEPDGIAALADALGG